MYRYIIEYKHRIAAIDIISASNANDAIRTLQRRYPFPITVISIDRSKV